MKYTLMNAEHEVLSFEIDNDQNMCNVEILDGFDYAPIHFRVKSRDSAKLSATTVATIGVPLYACGGGTVAKYMAKRNIDTIDAVVPVLSMHSPYELTAKFDCYMTYKAAKSMYDSKK